MTRQTRLAALALLGVLVSAVSVGSQDPYRARSEAQSAASATPVVVPSDSANNTTAPNDPYRGSEAAAPSAETQVAPYAENAPSAIAAPQSIAPAANPAPVMAAVVPDQAPAAGSAVHSAATEAPRSDARQSASSDRRSAQTPMFVPITQGSATAPTPATDLSQAPQLPVVEELSARPEDANVRYEVATHHLMDAVPDDIEPYFDLFMYVSKAGKGPLGQHMFVFQRDADGKIVPYAEWRVSTGREQWEIHNDRKIHTVTPEGIFTLDPNRFYRKYWSHTWDNAPMHYAMFYDTLTNGAHSGIAIHAAIGQSKIDRLGRRDSAGCIRLAPRNAKELFYKVQNTTRGEVPVFAMNERHSTDRWGKAERTEAGSMVLQDGYRALLYVENFDGNQETVGPVVAYTH